jgi:hypothetical protein|nr:MAG TPA: hypothetical protein [Caudoviricetes sp.]
MVSGSEFRVLSAKTFQEASFLMAIFILLIAFAVTVSVAFNYDLKSQKTRNIGAENKAMIGYGISTALLVVLICLYK